MNTYINRNINNQKQILAEEISQTIYSGNIFKTLAEKGLNYIQMYESNTPVITTGPNNNNNLRQVQTFIKSLNLNEKTINYIMNLNKTPEGQKQVKALLFNIPLYMRLNSNPNFDKTKFIEEYKKYLNSNMINLPKNISNLPPDVWGLILAYLSLEDGGNFLKALKN